MNAKPIDIRLIDEEFNNHLLLKANNRIIFSGKFGTGKTFFLDRFFRERKGRYFTVNLKPVNYSVASNEDIFRLIKYDILLQLEAAKAINWESIEFSKLEYLPFYLTQNSGKLVNSLISAAASLDTENSKVPIVARLAMNIPNIFGRFNQKHSQVNKPAEQTLYEDFFKSVDNSHLLVQNDLITLIIQSALFEICEPTNSPILASDGINGGKKESVLIIDDLDRVDPEHIFRILNVFSAHLNNYNDDNLLGFTKVILVCDFENIKQIYAARYGKNVDFNGYIDRFYSSHIFEFVNINAIKDSCYEYFDSLKRSALDGFLFSSYEAEISYGFICSFLNVGILNLRSLIKILTNDKPNSWPGTLNQKVVWRKSQPGKATWEFLIWVFGSTNKLIEAIDKLNELASDSSRYMTPKNLERYTEFFCELIKKNGYLNPLDRNPQRVNVNGRIYLVHKKDEKSDFMLSSPNAPYSDTDFLFLIKRCALAGYYD